MMKSLFAAAAASALILPSFLVPANAARGGMGGAVGKDPKVCLLTFSSAAAAQSGADVEVVKAQYVPLRIALKFEARNPSVTRVAYYGFGDLSATHQGQIDFYYPDGSTSEAAGVTVNSDTETLCEGFMAYAESQDDGDDD